MISGADGECDEHVDGVCGEKSWAFLVETKLMGLTSMILGGYSGYSK